MLRKLPWILMTLLLLLACATAQPSIVRATIPLPPFTAEDQKAAADLIAAKCGSPVPHCPADAVLERATLAYVKLRAEVEAANKH